MSRSQSLVIISCGIILAVASWVLPGILRPDYVVFSTGNTVGKDAYLFVVETPHNTKPDVPGLYVLSTDQENQNSLPGMFVRDSQFDVSPDCGALAYTNNVLLNGRPIIYRYDLATGQHSERSYDLGAVSYSTPTMLDDQHVAFVMHREFDQAIIAIDWQWGPTVVLERSNTFHIEEVRWKGESTILAMIHGPDLNKEPAYVMADLRTGIESTTSRWNFNMAGSDNTFRGTFVTPVENSTPILKAESCQRPLWGHLASN